MEVIEVIEKEVEVIEVIERGPQGPAGAGISTLTTRGDLLYRGDTTGERLPIGTSGQILKVSATGIPEWGAAPSSGVSSVSGTAPIVSSGGATPAISITAATISAAGSMSAADKTKLDGIAAGAEVNVNADWNAGSGDAQILNKPTIPSASSSTPSALGTAAAGTSSNYSRADHVHAMPSAADVGAAADDDPRLSDSRDPNAHASSHQAGESDELFDQNLSTTDEPTFSKLTLTPDPEDSSLKLGTLEFQSYALNNAWIGDNIYFDGGQFKRRAQGAATLFYFQGNEGQFRCAESESAGEPVGSAPVFKVGAGGKFAAGPDLSSVGDFENALLYCDGNNVGFSDKADPLKKATLDVSGVEAGQTRSLAVPDQSGTIALAENLGTAAAEDATAFATSAQGDKADSALQPTLVDAKGDLLVGSAADTVSRLAVGATNGHVLQVDSSTATGLKWAAAPAGDTVSIDSTAADILSATSGAISADDAGADKIVFWDDSAGKLTHLTVGSGLTLTDTTLTASGGASIMQSIAVGFVLN